MTVSTKRIVLAVMLSAVLVAGCGGSKDDGKPTATATASPTRSAEGVIEARSIDERTAGLVQPRMSEEKVISLLGGDPILRQAPTRDFEQGCIFYPIAKQRLSNVWQFCFDDRGIKLVVTALSPSHPDPPADASEAREVLLARGDSVCQSQYGHLNGITKQVSKALAAFGRRDTPATRKQAGRQIARFIENLDVTHEKLEAFEAPPDELDVYGAYVDSMGEQEAVLRQARASLLRGQIDAYEELGDRFSEIGQAAEEQAEDYGFSTCRASRWG